MPRVRRGDVVWVEPVLVAEVAFAEWTHDGRLRAPVYLGLRDDKSAADVRRERAPAPEEIREGRRVLKLSNLDKPFWPEEGITKGDLIAYYRDVAPVLVPHLRDRPFTMKRYPDGWEGNFFFQKNAPSHMPEWIPRAELPASTREGEKKTIAYPLVNDRPALLWMANMGCIDMNAWYSRVDKPDRPDFVLFDLDPSPDVGFPETIEVALLVRQALELLELECCAKTSGSRGIHVLVPIARRHTYDDTRRFAEVIAGAIARANPGLATTEWSKKKRRGVLIDANQNGAGKTIASAYSVRPRAGAPVSTPLRWDEVRPGLDPAAFTMDAVLDRVAREGDLFEPVLHGKQSLTRALKALTATLVARPNSAEHGILEALDPHGDGAAPVGAASSTWCATHGSPRGLGAHADGAVAELLRDAARGLVALQPGRDRPSRRRGRGTRARARRRASPSRSRGVDVPAEPRPRGDGAGLREALGADALCADQQAVGPDEQVQRPLLGRPRGERLLVEGDEAVDEPGCPDAVRPGDRERHLVRRMDPALGQSAELEQLVVRPEPQLELRRAEPEPVEGLHHSSLWGDRASRARRCRGGRRARSSSR